MYTFAVIVLENELIGTGRKNRACWMDGEEVMRSVQAWQTSWADVRRCACPGGGGSVRGVRGWIGGRGFEVLFFGFESF